MISYPAASAQIFCTSEASPFEPNSNSNVTNRITQESIIIALIGLVSLFAPIRKEVSPHTHNYTSSAHFTCACYDVCLRMVKPSDGIFCLLLTLPFLQFGILPLLMPRSTLGLGHILRRPWPAELRSLALPPPISLLVRVRPFKRNWKELSICKLLSILAY